MDELTAAMDNVTAMRLGQVVVEAARTPAGDSIDQGLVLLRLLNEAGFAVVHRSLR